MGIVYVYASFTGPKGKKTVKAVVDTGSNFSFLNKEIAKDIGLKAGGTQEVTLANNKKETFQAAMVPIQIAGRRVLHVVLMGDLPDAIIGVETLEHMGLKVDPKKGEVLPSRSWVARA